MRDEAVLYYHRYVALLALEDFAGVIRDTTRNLEVFDLCRRYATEPSDQTILEQFRSHVLSMRTRAEAGQALRAGNARAAIEAIDRGLQEIRLLSAMPGDPSAGAAAEFENSNDARLLRAMRDALIPKLPSSQKMELRERLASAIRAENYELAAILRDELRLMPD